MTHPRYRLSPGNGPRPASLEPNDDAAGSLLGPEQDDEDERERADELRVDSERDQEI